MAEYIKREDAIHDIRYDCFGLENYTRRDAIDCINALPAADVTEVRHGRWITEENESVSKRNRLIKYGVYSCSICGRSNGRMRKKYCPNCGALMKEAEHES